MDKPKTRAEYLKRLNQMESVLADGRIEGLEMTDLEKAHFKRFCLGMKSWDDFNNRMKFELEQLRRQHPEQFATDGSK